MESIEFSLKKKERKKNRGLRLAILLLSFFLIYPALNSNAGWTQLNSGTTRHLYSLFFISPSTGWVVGEGIILKTTNGGVNWTNQTADTNELCYSISFINSNTGYLGGYNDFFFVGFIRKTTNSGAAWFYQQVLINADVSSFFFVDSLSGYACGSQIILKTTNAGTNWNQSYSSANYFSELYFTSLFTGYCVGVSGGQSGIIMKTTNSGTNWYSQSFGLYTSFGSVFFPSTSNGYAAGSSYLSALIYRTTNAGINWFDASPTGFLAIYSIYFTDLNSGYTAGRSGQILKTTNAGNNWYSQSSGTINNLNGITFADMNTGYAVGTGGVILKTTDGGGPIGIIPIKNEIPKEFSLEQNYPNPFNPTSKIRFQIAKRSFVNLSVYDILGRIIEVLVNEELKPGTYEVEFNGSNYPSGTYFYRLNAKDYTETKRMVLAK